MSKLRSSVPGAAWFGEMVEAIRRILVFGRGTPAPARPRKVKPVARKRAANAMDKRAAEVRKLAAAGVERHEIARRTRLSQDTVAMLMHLAAVQPAESSGQGTFFRILQTRMAA